MKKIFFSIATLLLSLVSMVSCEDDPVYDSSYVGEGDAAITAEITFNSLVSALSRADVSGGTPGNAVKDIENVCVVLYRQDGTLAGKYYFDKSEMTVSDTQANPSDRPSDSDASGAHRAEESTKKAKVHIDKVPYGRYYMYAVANVPESALTDDVVASASNLKNLQLTWNSSDIAANSQMFGYFSSDNKSDGFAAPLMTVNKPSMTLHAWVKRAVSKVTVAFDGTGLKDGVKIYIKSVAIKDIPLHCALGADSPSAPDSKIELVENGQVITYGEGKDYNDDWVGFVSNKHPVNGYNQAIVNDESLSTEQKLKALHSEDARAFYMFENLQGKGVDNSMSDKRQQVNDQHREDGVVSFPDGVDPSNPAWKDAKPYGSYIEVKAHYDSGTSWDKEGQGEIVYRFMLGKDTHLDYNTERNYHYKLTLKFKGWANDIDWHIDYRKGPDKVLRFPRPFYISYIYGQSSMVPIEFDVDEDVTITKVEATIMSNNWAPENCNYKYGVFLNQSNETTIKNSQPGENWYKRYALYVDDPVTFGNYNGFLSLRKPDNMLIVPGDAPWTLSSNESHYNTKNLGSRLYDDVKISEMPLYQSMTEDSLHVERVNRTYFIKLPIWTRARQLIKETGYTGNNPYEAYYRKASVHVEVTLSNGEVLKSDADEIVAGNDGKKDVEIRQVRRIVNPKGVWRSSDKYEPFHVVLKALGSVADSKFEDLQSDGPWRAYVMHDTQADVENGSGGFVYLTGSTGTTTGTTTFDDFGVIKTRQSIEGKNGKIDFHINFSGPNTGTPRYAIVRVEYNYNSCYHLIFVRQGYEADDTFGDGNRWCTANNYDRDNLAENPLDEGSLFRFGNWNGIKSESNVNGWSTQIVTPDDFDKNLGNNLKMTDGTTKNWADIAWKAPIVKDGLDPPLKGTTFDSPGGGRRIAGYDDYSSLVPKNLKDENEVKNFKIETGYGVLYGDGATETAGTVDEAFGYKAGGPKTRGMRGCFVYDRTNGKNLFFPVGSSGYGHRKSHTSNNKAGVLRYSSAGRWGYFDAVNAKSYKFGVFSAPLFFDIFRSSGAIYWFSENKVKDETDNVGWDINYSTFDFAAILLANVHEMKTDWATGKVTTDYGADACFIRCIEN